jgi:Lar family restriction alleviation protein
LKTAELERNEYTEIKDCPFCGGHSTLAYKSKTIIKGELTYITYVYCNDCNSRGRRVVLEEDGRTARESRELAIAHWNRRV